MSYSPFEFRMRSIYMGSGYSSWRSNFKDLVALIKYLKGTGMEKKVVVMGSSSGKDWFRIHLFPRYLKHC